MEREIKVLKEKVLELSQENVALRDINVQFQLENFKLKNKIKKLERSHTFQDVIEEKEATVEFDPVYDPDAEYLEEEEGPPRKSRALNRSIEKTNSSSEVEENEEECKDQKEIDIDGIPEPSPAEATKTIFAIAAERGILDRIKSIEGGKQKDSSFVNKLLDLVFDRQTLANSSVRGQKCQAKPDLAARPALNPLKLSLCRQAFLYRLKREGLSSQAQENRMKSFNSYVNFKVQNARKLIKR